MKNLKRMCYQLFVAGRLRTFSPESAPLLAEYLQVNIKVTVIIVIINGEPYAGAFVFSLLAVLVIWWLVWRGGNGIGHINKVNLRRAQLVPGLMTTFGGLPSQYLSRPTQPRYPSMRCNEYWQCNF